MRRVVFAAALALGLTPTEPAESAVSFPVTLDVFYCWYYPNCTFTRWTMRGDRTAYDVLNGVGGDWRYTKPDLDVLWDDGTEYNGWKLERGCFEGTMTDTTGREGIWAACR